MRLQVDDCRLGGGAGPAVIAIAGDRISVDRDMREAVDGRLAGTLLPGIVDAHVHLGLVAPEMLAQSRLSAVVDFGWSPDAARGWVDGDFAGLRTDTAGTLHAAPGGYPSQASWADPSATTEIAGPDDAEPAVAALLRLGARLCKITLNTDAGPVLDDASLSALVDAAHAAGLPVAVHAQGEGQAERAFTFGADILAHTPWTHTLSDDLLTAMARRMRWISTLDIHGWGDPTEEHARAIDNLRRFVALGGRVVYGTDLGNGPLPPGLNTRELTALAACGLSAPAILDSLTGFLPPRAGVLPTFVPGPVPADAAEMPAWLATAVRGDVDALAALAV